MRLKMRIINDIESENFESFRECCKTKRKFGYNGTTGCRCFQMAVSA